MGMLSWRDKWQLLVRYRQQLFLNCFLNVQFIRRLLPDYQSQYQLTVFRRPNHSGWRDADPLDEAAGFAGSKLYQARLILEIPVKVHRTCVSMPRLDTEKRSTAGL